MSLGIALRMARGMAKSGPGKPTVYTIYHAKLLGGWQCNHRHYSEATALRCGRLELERRRRLARR
jgi:hypothetical protein